MFMDSSPLVEQVGKDAANQYAPEPNSALFTFTKMRECDRRVLLLFARATERGGL